MKKSLVALAVLAAAGAASAQSTVTLFGIVDATVQRVKADDNGSVTRMAQGGLNSSRLGFRGVEDLGGGMSASFWLEAGLNNDSGSGANTSTGNQTAQNSSGGLTFNRRSTISLSGGFGEIRLGRDFVPTFWNHTNFDPFGTNGVGSLNNLSLALGSLAGVQTTVRASNSIGYFLPKMGGVYGQVMYALGENASNSAAATKDDGEHVGARLGFASGPFDVAFSYGSTEVTGVYNSFSAANGGFGLGSVADGKYQDMNFAGSYDLGVAKLIAVYVQEKAKANIGTIKHKTYMLGALVPVGKGTIRASYSSGKSDFDLFKGNQFAIGYVHNLSKRTAVYTTYARIANKGEAFTYNNGRATASLGGNLPAVARDASADTSGFEIGVRHSF